LTWTVLTSPAGIAALLAAGIIPLAKRLGAEGRATILVALLGGQLLAQAAFWRERGISADGFADGFLVGLIAAILAVGGHQTVRAVRGGSWGATPPAPD